MTLYNIALFEMRVHYREIASTRCVLVDNPPMIRRFSFVVKSHTYFIKYYSLEPEKMWQHYVITLNSSCRMDILHAAL